MTDENDTVTTALPMHAAGPDMRMVEVALITASLTNPRKTFDQAKLGELAQSIKGTGLHQPVLLRPLPGSRLAETFDFRREGSPLPTYELVCGERRLRASRIAELAEIPAMIRELTDDQVLEIQIVENLQRDDLSPLEEAEGYETLMQHGQINADQVAEKVGKSRSYVYGRLKLLDLCHSAREALREGKMDASKALLVARIPDHKLQIEATERITKEDRWDGGVMSARAAAKMVQEEYMLRLDKAKFPIADADLIPHAGACGTCPKRTGHQPELFADVKSADVCTDPTCYKAKEGVESGGCFLVGYRGRIFQIFDDFQVGESVEQFDAVGCGAAFAIGAFHASADRAPISRLKVALTIAEKCSAGVRSPFVFLEGGAA